MSKDIANHWQGKIDRRELAVMKGELRRGTIEYLELVVAVSEIYQDNLQDAIRDLQEIQERLLKASEQVKEERK